MLPFAAASVIRALTEMEWRATLLHNMVQGGGKQDDKHTTEVKKMLTAAVEDLQEALKDVPLSDVLRNQFQRLRRAVGETATIAFDHPEIRAQDFLRDFCVEMTGHYFLLLPANDARLFVDAVGWFEQGKKGKPVLHTFPKVRTDMEGAGRCCALGQWNAAVFHAMCILDVGLVRMVEITGAASPKKPESWHHLIEAIEDRLDALRGLHPMTPKAKRIINRYAPAAVQLRNFKDAWRNHTMHGRKTYDESQTRPILNAVRTFMQEMAR